MKKIIPFTKDIKFNTKIYEITSISLEHNLVIEESNLVSGEFIVSGEYKMNDSSINTEPFIHGLPFDIELDAKYDMDKFKIDIDDFKYEIINEEILRVNIDVIFEGVPIYDLEEDDEEEIKPDLIIEARNEKIESDLKELGFTKEDNEIKEEEIKKEESMNLFLETEESAKEVIKEDKKEVTSIFNNFDDNDEYVTYYVHIVRDNENIEMIASKYNVDIDLIKEYNDLNEITLGSKLIIPQIINETI